MTSQALGVRGSRVIPMRRSLVWIMSLCLAASVGGAVSVALAEDEGPIVDVGSSTEAQIAFLFSEASEIRTELTVALDSAETTAEVNGLTALYSEDADRLERRALDLASFAYRK